VRNSISRTFRNTKERNRGSWFSSRARFRCRSHLSSYLEDACSPYACSVMFNKFNQSLADFRQQLSDTATSTLTSRWIRQLGTIAAFRICSALLRSALFSSVLLRSAPLCSALLCSALLAVYLSAMTSSVYGTSHGRSQLNKESLPAEVNYIASADFLLNIKAATITKASSYI
jgi:hypothetical protein